MENKINVTVEGNQITILEGKANTPKEPINLGIIGNIDSISRFLEKRLSLAYSDSHVIVNREKLKMALMLNPTNPYTAGVVEGKIIEPEIINSLGINTGKHYMPHELADFLKMNRFLFTSKDVANNLISELRDFKAKIDKECEMRKDERGNIAAKRSQIVNSNIPDGFVIEIEIFKGLGKKAVAVEICINPETIGCTLISPQLNEIRQEILNEIIDSEIEKIKKLQPELLIIEC